MKHIRKSILVLFGKREKDPPARSRDKNKSRSFILDAAKRSKVWLGMNAAGLMFYLWVSHLNWPEFVGEEGYIVTGNDAIGWGFTALPIQVLMILSNASWATFNLGRRNWPVFLLSLLVLMFWIFVHPIEALFGLIF